MYGPFIIIIIIIIGMCVLPTLRRFDVPFEVGVPCINKKKKKVLVLVWVRYLRVGVVVGRGDIIITYVSIVGKSGYN